MPTTDENIQAGFEEVAGVIKTHGSFIANSCRVYCHTDNRWISDSDDVRGFNAQDAAENAGTNTNPLAEWEHLGMVIPAGYTIKNLHMALKCNNAEVTDVEICALLRHPDPITRWETGLDNDAEDVDTYLYKDLWINPVGGETVYTCPLSDLTLRNLPINHDVTQNSILSLYFKPVGTLTATRYVYATYNWELIKT